MSNVAQRESFHANKNGESSRSSYVMRWEAAVTESPKIGPWLNAEPHAATKTVHLCFTVAQTRPNPIS